MAMGLGGMLGGFKMPEHTSWAGAIAGGTVDAGKAIWNAGKTAVTGTVDFPDGKGGTKAVDFPRTLQLKNLGNAISGAYSNHTFSMREPERFKAFQQAAAKFQGQGGGAF